MSCFTSEGLGNLLTICMMLDDFLTNIQAYRFEDSEDVPFTSRRIWTDNEVDFEAVYNEVFPGRSLDGWE